MAAVVEKSDMTKERARLARERREERERTQASRENELREKEQRSRKQYERSLEERGRRLEEQRQREEHRRAAVEQKRRKRVEEEKEHLETLMRRSDDRGLPSEQRHKRWTWGGPPRACEDLFLSHCTIYMISFICPACKSISYLPASNKPTREHHPDSVVHHNDINNSPCPRERRSTEKQTGVITDSSAKRLESPMTPTKSMSGSKKPSTPKRSKSCKSRIQSPCSPGQFPSSPMRPQSYDPGQKSTRGWTERRKESRLEPPTPRRLPDCWVRSDGWPESRKEQEEKQRLEEERLKAEELQRKQAEERERQELAAQQAEKERQRQEEERRKKEEDDKRQKERRLKDLQDQLDREREEALQRRKKRIEEIMKRTRKTDTEPKDETHIESNTSVIGSVSVLESADAGQINGPSIRSSGSSSFCEFKSEFPSSITVGSPVINLQPLEAKCSAADDLSDGVQSMDVSPVSRDELMQEYSPVSESSEILTRNPEALDLLHLTGQAAYPKAGDCNKNLIQSFSNAAADSALIQSLGPSMDKLTV
ncbi:hypothetical protein Q7C36_023113 [Tachysurus vachellii]|uniref:MAP7 domain-containing protein 2 n=1 Tax=Tachysurus vachellii TaxID=175792 RepID=A0AA88IZT4_TACVA|nr:hypothetical protein Q7C36_023113 [Tachysurus vachellii]